MGADTAIQWTDHTWNPWQGCTKVSAGCKHCYMYRDKARYGQDPATVVRSKAATFKFPLSGKVKPGDKVFVCSWSDFFHEAADAWRMQAWEIIRQRPDVIFQLVTKRPERIAACLPRDWGGGWPNVWGLVSVEDQAAADLRVPILLDLPFAVRGVSCEPLLGPVDLRPWLATGLLHWVIVGGESA
jgi:protein gp37